jgi:hypothetical protein
MSENRGWRSNIPKLLRRLSCVANQPAQPFPRTKPHDLAVGLANLVRQSSA